VRSLWRKGRSGEVKWDALSREGRMDAQTTQDDVIHLIVTDRFFGATKKSVDPSDTSIHGGTLDGMIDIFWCNSL